MMGIVTYLFDALRYPVALVVLIGLAGVLMTTGFLGLGSVLKIIATGIIVNGAALLVLVWIYRLGRKWWARRAADDPSRNTIQDET